MTFKSSSTLGTNLLLAERLIQLGARPPIVSQLCQLTRKQSIDFFKAVKGQAPKQGMLPHDHQWAIRSTSNNIHASLFLGIFHDIRQRLAIQHSSAETLINAYGLYHNVASKISANQEEPFSAAQQLPLDINRAWSLISMLLAGDLTFNVCTRCKTRYLGMIHRDATFRQCPVCNVWTDRTGRRRWISARSNTPT